MTRPAPDTRIDTSTYQQFVKYNYSAGGLRTMKWYYHWVDTCWVGREWMMGGPMIPIVDSLGDTVWVPLGGDSLGFGGGEGYIPPPPPCCEPFYQSDFTYYVRGQSGNVLAEFADLDGSPTARYIYAGSQRIAMVDSDDNVYYYLNDHLGSAGVLIASDGTVRDIYKYKPFGEGAYGGTVNVGQAYRYTGKPLDEELDMDWYYYGARYYDPSTGRFLSVDPLNSKYPGWSPYVYCLNNPLKYTDPDGAYSVRAETRYLGGLERVTIYVPNWRTGFISVIDAFTPLGLVKPLEEWEIKDYGEVGIDIVKRTKLFSSRWFTKGGKFALGLAQVAIGLYDFFTDYRDPDWLIEEYWRRYRNAAPCLTADCVHRRIEKIRKAEEKRRDRQQKQQADADASNEEDTQSDAEETQRDNTDYFFGGWSAQYRDPPR